MTLKTEHRVMVVFAVLGGLLLVLVAQLAFSTQRAAAAFRDVDASNQVMVAVEDVFVDLLNMQAAVRGFLLTRDENFLAPYERGERDVDRASLALLETTASDPVQLARARRIDVLRGELTALFMARIAERRGPNFRFEDLPAKLQESKLRMDEVRSLVAAIENQERATRLQRSERVQQDARHTQVLIAVLVVVAAAAILYGAVRTRRDLRGRAAAEQALSALNADLARQVALRTRELETEIARTRTLFEQAPDGIVLLGPDLAVIDANDAFARLLGRTRDEVRQLHAWDWDVLYPTAEAMRTAWPELPRTTQVFVTRIRRADGAERQIEVVCSPMRGHETPTIVNFCRDATERLAAEAALRASEARLRLALDAAHTGIFDWDLAADRIVWTRRHEEMWGFTPGSFSGTYAAFASRVHPDDLAGINANVARCIEQQQRFVHEFRVVWLDGSVHWISGRGEFEFDAAGKPLRMRGAVVEFTARRTAEEALAAERDRTQALARRLLTVQEQERRQLAHELHDQLGQSLTALKLGAQALQRLATPPLEQRLAGLVETASRALGETRSLSLQLRPPLLDDFGLIPALHWLLEQHEHCGIPLSLDGDLTDFRTSPEIEIAAFRIAQESVTNALRHAGASRIALHLTRPAGLLRLEIHDDGRGFDVAAVRTRIAREGSSLGLLGLDERARLAGGRFELISAPGVGTRIVAELPLPPLS